jgi:hypothetical protein
MLEAIVIIGLFMAIIAMIDGAFNGFAFVSTLAIGCFTFIFNALGFILGLGVLIYALSLLI